LRAYRRYAATKAVAIGRFDGKTHAITFYGDTQTKTASHGNARLDSGRRTARSLTTSMMNRGDPKVNALSQIVGNISFLFALEGVL
jgi:hypothetical protein